MTEEKCLSIGKAAGFTNRLLENGPGRKGWRDLRAAGFIQDAESWILNH